MAPLALAMGARAGGEYGGSSSFSGGGVNITVPAWLLRRTAWAGTTLCCRRDRIRAPNTIMSVSVIDLGNGVDNGSPRDLRRSRPSSSTEAKFTQPQRQAGSALMRRRGQKTVARHRMWMRLRGCVLGVGSPHSSLLLVVVRFDFRP